MKEGEGKRAWKKKNSLREEYSTTATAADSKRDAECCTAGDGHHPPWAALVLH